MGQDRIGLSSDLYSVIKTFNVRILDIGQSVIHDQVSQGMMLAVPNQDKTASAKLIEKAESLGLKLKVREISQTEYQEWVSQQGQDRYTLSLLTREVSDEEIARVTAVTSEQGLNIHDIVRLSGRLPLGQPVSNATKSCIEFALQALSLIHI